MPLILSAVDALPYIDAAPNSEDLGRADALIQAELKGTASRGTLHPSLPITRASKTSPLIQAEFDRLENGVPKEGGIDLSRYDVLDAPNKGELAAWRTTMQRAYASSEYLRDRELNLALLETYGKNAWLIGNGQLEDILKTLEGDLELAKIELEQVEQARRDQQNEAAGEMRSLEETWKLGIGRMIEAQVAGERLRQDILERRRHGAS